MSAPRARPARGMMVVELAVVLGAGLFFLSILLVGGRLMWHYTVLQRAAFDAARYMATMSRPELGDPAQAPVLAARARQLVLDAVGAARLDTAPGANDILVLCDGLPCSGAIPQKVGVTLQIRLTDPFFRVTGTDGLTLSSSSVQPYVN